MKSVLLLATVLLLTLSSSHADNHADVLSSLPAEQSKDVELGEVEDPDQEQAEIAAQKKEAADEAAAPKDSLDQVVPASKVHASVKQTLVEEEKLYSLMSFNFRKGAEGSFSYTDYYVRHMNRNMMVSTVNGPMDRQDATFKVVHALCEPGQGSCPAQNAGSTGCVSLEAVNYPGYFLGRTETGTVEIVKADGSESMAATASMCIQTGLAEPNAVSFEFLGQTGQFLRHAGYSLFACKADDEGECNANMPNQHSARKTQFGADSTWFLKPGLFMGRCAGPEKANDCTCYPGFLGDQCTLKCPGRERKGNALTVCSGQGDCTLAEDGTATCKCMPGFLGRKCNLLCPRDKNGNLCSGRGQCAVDDKFQPVCECEKGFLGDICQYQCPGGDKSSGSFCSGHGSCYIREEDLAEKRPKRAECTCEPGFKGFSCDKACPRDGAGTICGGHGTCDMKDEKAVCVCTYGWRGLDCTTACPRNERGQVCSTNGLCAIDKQTNNAVCRCKPGFGGNDCSITCPGLSETGQPCNGNGHCEVDAEKREAVCKCKKTHMGEACTHRCPMDPHSDLACGGADRGTCVRDEEELPSGTRCDCKEPYAGKTCHVTCPMFQGQICGGNGECFIRTTGKLSVGICKCDVGFTGPNCQGKCPRGTKTVVEGANAVDKEGEVCAGHGTCSFTQGQRAECTCDQGWATQNCEQRICRTPEGVFNKETEECTCPAGQVCCERETVRLAEEMKKMLEKEAKHRQSKVKVESTFK
eukprot:TRINITY_DN2320_c0_g1_i1.p1 TRINITY_DN2320_c0_g1~~TRINITY_DN2320_c0_g1_i1.p1  ORF type:complete len:753 (-),score=191.29 TRINITY_DN2320_c0_g1_i1:289-2547(-)